MSAPVLLGIVFGIGSLLVLMSQPYGRPRPALRERLEALRPEVERRTAAPKVSAFSTSLFEQGLRPFIEHIGQFMTKWIRRLGIDLAETESRLMITGDPGGLTLFLGQKVISALIGFTLLPLAGQLRLAPQTPKWLWMALAAGAFVFPDAVLRSKVEQRSKELREGLARFTDLVALSVSGGLGLEASVEEACTTGEGPFFEELRQRMTQALLDKDPVSKTVAGLAADLNLPDAEPLAAAIAAAESHGAAISKSLRAQARSIREKRRVELIQAGERSNVRMSLPVGLLILPAFFLLILYPAAVQLLQISMR